uniref:Tetratricopeptide repeat domain 32 n=1 Tax=Lates calcarifer TaxID=8187 RepID=A0A4W6F2Y3_LATCA
MEEANSQILDHANSEFKKKNFKQAEELYTEFISSCLQSRKCTAGDLATAYNNRGQIKYLRVDFHEAVEDCTSAIQADSQFEIPFYNRGLIHYRLGKNRHFLTMVNGKINTKLTARQNKITYFRPVLSE